MEHTPMEALFPDLEEILTGDPFPNNRRKSKRKRNLEENSFHKYPVVGVYFCSFCKEEHPHYPFSCRLCNLVYDCNKQCFMYEGQYICGFCKEDLHLQIKNPTRIDIFEGEKWNHFRRVDYRKFLCTKDFEKPCLRCKEIHKLSLGRCMFCETHEQCRVDQRVSIYFRWVCLECVQKLVQSVQRKSFSPQKLKEIQYNIIYKRISFRSF